MAESVSELDMRRLTESGNFSEQLGSRFFTDWHNEEKKEEKSLIADTFLRLSLGLGEEEMKDLNSQMQEKPPFDIFKALVDKNLEKLGDKVSPEQKQELEKLLTCISEKSSQLSLDDFINRLSLLDPNSLLSTLMNQIISNLPKNLKTALAIQSF